MNSSSTETAAISRTTLLHFALLVGGCFVALGAIRQWRHPSTWSLASMLLGTVMIVLGFIAPRLLTPAYRAWMRFAEVLGRVQTAIILTVVFFLVVTPLGIIMRLLRKSPIERQRRADSYWIEVKPHSYGDRHVEKQF